MGSEVEASGVEYGNVETAIDTLRMASMEAFAEVWVFVALMWVEREIGSLSPTIDV